MQVFAMQLHEVEFIHFGLQTSTSDIDFIHFVKWVSRVHRLFEFIRFGLQLINFKINFQIHFAKSFSSFCHLHILHHPMMWNWMQDKVLALKLTKWLFGDWCVFGIRFWHFSVFLLSQNSSFRKFLGKMSFFFRHADLMPQIQLKVEKIISKLRNFALEKKFLHWKLIVIFLIKFGWKNDPFFLTCLYPYLPTNSHFSEHLKHFSGLYDRKRNFDTYFQWCSGSSLLGVKKLHTLKKQPKLKIQNNRKRFWKLFFKSQPGESWKWKQNFFADLCTMKQKLKMLQAFILCIGPFIMSPEGIWKNFQNPQVSLGEKKTQKKAILVAEFFYSMTFCELETRLLTWKD